MLLPGDDMFEYRSPPADDLHHSGSSEEGKKGIKQSLGSLFNTPFTISGEARTFFVAITKIQLALM